MLSSGFSLALAGRKNEKRKRMSRNRSNQPQGRHRKMPTTKQEPGEKADIPPTNSSKIKGQGTSEQQARSWLVHSYE